MKIYICQVCGHIAFNNLQDKCPVCGAEKDKFYKMMQFLKNPSKRALKLKLNMFRLLLLTMRVVVLSLNPVAMMSL